MPEVTLWPGLLARADATFARRSSLHAADGVLTVRHGRRHRRFEVPGGTLGPPPSSLDKPVVAHHLVTLVDADGTPACTLDLLQWLPGPVEAGEGSDGAGAWWSSVVDDLAEALGARRTSRAASGAGARVTPVDEQARTLLLAACLVAALCFVVGVGLSPGRASAAWPGAAGAVVLAGLLHVFSLPRPGTARAEAPDRLLLTDPQGRQAQVGFGSGTGEIDRVRDAPDELVLLAGRCAVLRLEHAAWATAATGLVRRTAEATGLPVQPASTNLSGPRVDAGPTSGATPGLAPGLVLLAGAGLTTAFNPAAAVVIALAGAVALAAGWLARR